LQFISFALQCFASCNILNSICAARRHAVPRVAACIAKGLHVDVGSRPPL
jgi:hypothetical protein